MHKISDRVVVIGDGAGGLVVLCAFEQDLNKDEMSRLKGRHEALLASREALGKGAGGGGGGGEDFIPLDGKVPM